MIRLEGETLPKESQGQIVPWLFGDVILDVPGIPLQIGHAVNLADNCGVDATESRWRISGPDLQEWLPKIVFPVVGQVDFEWVLIVGYSPGGTTGGVVIPWFLTVSRPYGGTTAAVHAKGATLTFLESRPVWVFAEAPPGLNYPADMVVALRYNDVAQMPTVTMRLDDTRWIPGKRLVTAEMDLTKGFGGLPAPTATMAPSNSAPLGAALTPVPTPSAVAQPATFTARMGSASSGVGVMDYGGSSNVVSFASVGASGGSSAEVLGGTYSGFAPAPPTPSGTTTEPSAAALGTTVARPTPNASAALGRLTADLRGLIDTVAGTYSGTPNAPLIAPDAVTAVILALNYGETDRHLPTWTATRVQQTEWGIQWRLVWLGLDFEAFRSAAGLNGLADLWLDDDGEWRYTARPKGPGAIVTVATITDRELLTELSLSFLPPSATRLPVTWGFGHQGGNFTAEDPSGLARHGIINDRSLSLAYVSSEGIARFVTRWWQRRWAQQVATTTAAVAPCFAALTRLDNVLLDTTMLDIYGPRRLPWEIRGTTDRGEQRVLILVEADPSTEGSPPPGQLVLLGYPPVLKASDMTARLVLTGYAPRVFSPIRLTPGAGTLGVTGYAPLRAVLAPAKGSLTLTGYAPTTVLSGGPITLTPGPAALGLTGRVASVGASASATPGPGPLALTGWAPTVTVGAPSITLIPGAGSLLLAGLAATLTRATTLTPDPGSLTLTGVAPSAGGPVSATPGAGSLTVTGYAPTATIDTPTAQQSGYELLLDGSAV